MKTPLLYGFMSALVGAVVMFGLHFAGYYDEADKLGTGRTIGMVLGIVVIVAAMVLAIRERRADCPADKEWGYGSALGTAFLTGLFSTVFSTIVAYAYFSFINPGFSDLVFQAEVAKMEAAGAAQEQIDAASGIMRKMMSPGVMTVMQLFGGIVTSLLIALIVAIFFRKQPAAAPSEVGTPPVV